jgi:hypothetical protein
MKMIDSKGRTYQYSSLDLVPAVEVTSPVSGEITFTPPDDTIFKYTRSPYRFYVRVFETLTDSYAVPESGEENIINIRKEF